MSFRGGDIQNPQLYCPHMPSATQELNRRLEKQTADLAAQTVEISALKQQLLRMAQLEGQATALAQAMSGFACRSRRRDSQRSSSPTAHAGAADQRTGVITINDAVARPTCRSVGVNWQ